MNYSDRYAAFLRSKLKIEDSVRVVFDSSNGSTGPILKRLFSDTEVVQAVFINDEPDGSFPAHGPNPSAEGATDDLRKRIVKEGADIGAVFDSDGDRVIFLDNEGNTLDAYTSFGLIVNSFDPPYVVDSRGLAKFTMAEVDFVESKAGRRFVWQTMKKSGASLGVEGSGHYFFREFFSLDSGILAAVNLLNCVSGLGDVTLAEAARKLEKTFRLSETNLKVEDRHRALEKLREAFEGEDTEVSVLDGLSVFGEEYAFNARPSVTEPFLRVNVAARSEQLATKQLAKIKEIVLE